MHKIEFNRIALQPDKLLVGMAAKMSMANNTAASLWQRFMPRRKEIQGADNSVLYSVQKYALSGGFNSFTPETVFEKWAAVEVENGDSIPDEMQLFDLRGGHFAVFDHQGPPSEFSKTLAFIFQNGCRIRNGN